MSIQQHPGYHLGWLDAGAGDPLYPDASPEYTAGWKAWWDVKHGLQQLQEKQHAE